MLVIVNAAAGGGRALARWRAIAPRLRPQLASFTTLETGDPELIRAQLGAHLAWGETEFVAAGGDGTVNLVASCIVEHAPPELRERVKLGTVGLGSSNDFHKPPRTTERQRGIAYRLDFAHTVRHDVGVLGYEDAAGVERRRFWLLNASVGITAEANRAFNEPPTIVRQLKRAWPSAAMAYVALRSILGYRATRMTLTLDGATRLQTGVRNLGIVKNPHFTGMLRYDSPLEPNGGRFYVHLLQDVPLWDVTLALVGLARGRFTGRPGTRSWRAGELLLEARQPFTVEADGETVTARRARFSAIPAALQICT